MTRRGFVLLAVLAWLAAAGIAVFAATQTAHLTARTVTNRVTAVQREWHSRGCLEAAYAALHQRWFTTASTAKHRLWNRLDVAARSPGPEPDCRLRIYAAGSRLPINSSSDDAIARYLRDLGVARPGLAEAIADWIDSDTSMRRGGAEAGWYRTRALPAPIDAAASKASDLFSVRGLVAGDSTLLQHFDYSANRISLLQADRATLAVLPAVTPSLRESLLAGAVLEADVQTLSELERFVAVGERDAFREHFPSLVGSAELSPSHWVLVSAPFELHVVRAGNAIGRRGVGRLP